MPSTTLQPLPSDPQTGLPEPRTPTETAPSTAALSRFLLRADRASLAGLDSRSFTEGRDDLYSRYARFSGGDSLDATFTDSQLALYLVRLSETGQHRKACEMSGVTPLAIQMLRRRDQEFNMACVEARKLAVLDLADEVFRRGFEGVEKAVYYMGEECGKEIVYSDAAAFKLLEAEMPDKFTKRTKNENINTTPSSAESDLARKSLVDIIVAAAKKIQADPVDSAIDVTSESSSED